MRLRVSPPMTISPTAFDNWELFIRCPHGYHMAISFLELCLPHAPKPMTEPKARLTRKERRTLKRIEHEEQG